MATTGNFEAWGPAFPDSCLQGLFQTLIAEWPLFPRPNRRLENRITHNFLAHLQRATRYKVPFAFHFRPKLTSETKDSEKGEIDIAVRTGIDPFVFFPFECKRLNVRGADGSLRSQAGAYVGNEGMGCFLSGQYSGGGYSGGMIGYVLEGDVAEARSAVDNEILSRKQILESRSPHRLELTPEFENCTGLEKTCHRFRDGIFTIYHLFFPVHSDST